MLRDVILKLRPDPVATNPAVNQGTGQLSVKLPKIEIPKFSGKYSEWASFRDLFISLIHNNGSIDNVQKLHYLKSSVSGEAEQLLRHIPVTSSNYQVCWTQLESRYNNKKYLANCILKKLTSQRILMSESSSAIKQLLDTTRECLSALKNLGVNISSWDIMIVFFISQKLDAESRKLWEQKVTETALELPTLSMFEEFLENRFRSIEFLDPKVQKSEKTNCTHVATTFVSCSFCSEDHKICNCKKFAKETTDIRRNFAQTHHLCFNCLNTDHTVFQCNMSTRCRLCKKKHHTLLHPKSQKSTTDIVKADQPVNKSVVATVTASTLGSSNSQAHGGTSDKQNITTCFVNSPSQVLLATALVKAESNKKTTVVLRSLLDQGSQASFLTEAAVQLLGLKKNLETGLVSGLGGDRSSTIASKHTVFLTIQSRLDPNFTITVKAHVLNKLTCFLPSSTLHDVQSLPALSSMELADPSFGVPNRIDLLLGAEVYSQILLEGLIKGPVGSVIAQNTRLGWILSGTVHSSSNVNHSEQCLNIVNMHLAHTDQQFENDLLKKFWDMESEPSSQKPKHMTLEDQKCEELFSQTTTRDESGRYVVRLPFRTNDPLSKYGGSRNIAHKRFLMQEKRLSKTPELKAEYSKVINEYLSLGHMEEVSNPDKPDAVYLAHHAVVKQDKTTSKVRVVYDGSCTGINGVSLNDDLMTGPTLQPELRHLVMRWRCYPISIVADIVKMFRQVKIADEDADFQRIFWRDNPKANLKHLRLLRVTFGTTSAPFLAVRSLQQLARDDGEDVPLAQTRALTDFYMDDLMTGCHLVTEGVQIYEQMTTLLGRGGFPLQKWSSNSRELMEHIYSENQPETDLELKTDEVMKILGLTWNKEADMFQCTVRLPEVEGPLTKRRVISDIARLYDPLGWLAPAITTAKVFIQRLWLSGIGWDDPLPSSLREDWLEFRDDLEMLQKIRIPRWIKSSSQDDVRLELQGFSDASNVAYAAVVYARVIDRDGNVHVSLLTSKTRVAPIKQVSIPRLELCGAVLLAKLLNEVAEILSVPKHHLHAWTDSTIVLAWLSSHPSRWKTFIANRVSEILMIMDGSQWAHVSSKDNPADSASRGITPSECVTNDLWYRGPMWLHLKEILYSKGEELKDTTLEEKGTKCHVLTSDADASDSFLERFSILRKLVRVLAWCRRFCLPSNQSTQPWLTAKELHDVLQACIKRTQALYWTAEDLKDKKGKFSSLNPFKDDKGVWRVGGRLQKANLSENRKHPILIPRQSHLAKLIIGDAHEKTLHGGPLLMINYIQAKYWIVNLRNLVRSNIHKCMTCVRYSSQGVHPLMGQLPAARVTPSRPFLQSGLDYAGPIAIRTSKGRGHRSTKGYICLFVCMATRAIHLEVVSDLTSTTFLAAFKRFVSRRGHCADLWSDNGTTFVGAERELKTLLTAEKSSVAIEIADWLATNGTTCHRIPPYSPNFGGIWEARIRSTKSHLKRIIKGTLTFEEMTTALAQIEACLNSRPISRISDGSDEPVPLTPGHFLIGEPLVLVPDRNYESSNISSLRRWQLTQRMVQEFWRRWSREYLTHFLQRYKWKQCTPEPEIGDIVLVKEDNLPPARWLYGIITEKHSGSDKITRVVSLRCKGATIKRPVSKLCKLPVTD